MTGQSRIFKLGSIFDSTKYLRSLYSACLPSFHPDTGRWYPITRVQTSQRVLFSSGNSFVILLFSLLFSFMPVPVRCSATRAPLFKNRIIFPAFRTNHCVPSFFLTLCDKRIESVVKFISLNRRGHAYCLSCWLAVLETGR